MYLFCITFLLCWFRAHPRRQFVDLFRVSIHLSVCLSVYLSICLSVCVSVCLFVGLSVFPPTRARACLLIYLYVHLSLDLSVLVRRCVGVRACLCIESIGWNGLCDLHFIILTRIVQKQRNVYYKRPTSEWATFKTDNHLRRCGNY